MLFFLVSIRVFKTDAWYKITCRGLNLHVTQLSASRSLLCRLCDFHIYRCKLLANKEETDWQGLTTVAKLSTTRSLWLVYTVKVSVTELQKVFNFSPSGKPSSWVISACPQLSCNYMFCEYSGNFALVSSKF